MTVAEWTLLGAVLLYLLTLAPVKPLGYRTFDNANPRNPEFYTPGIRSRALGAHLNGIETFPFFAAAVLLAEFRHMPQSRIDILAVAFLAVRFAFVLAYLGNRPTLRSLLWNLGFFVNVAIFLMPWWWPAYGGL
ncbi:MAG TPA: MAPEG family protein [Rhizomicrobium sp.]|nr:MAPEG family protein [Rhizomicrobium sp.]